MVLCPIAIAVGCRKCPAFAVCPLKTVIGDYKREIATPESPPARAAAKPAVKRKPPTNRKGARARRPRR